MVVMHRPDPYSEEEMAAAWYSRDELKKLQFKLKKTIVLMLAESPKANSERYCTRGLESLTPSGQETKQQRRRAAWDTVLDEQEFQHEVGIPDPNLLADLYFEECRISLAAAISAGISDEETARALAGKNAVRGGGSKSESTRIRTILPNTLSRSGDNRAPQRRQDSIRREFGNRAA